MANELLVGGAFGIAGLAIAAATRRWVFDWGLIWGAMAFLALTFATRRWTGNFGGLRNPLFVAMAIIAVVAVTVTVHRGTGVARTPLPFLISLLGIYATVPDTESVLALLGVTGPMAIVWRPLLWAQPRWAGGAMMAVVVTLAVMSGGRGRESSIVGALAAMAVMGLVACRAWQQPTVFPLLVHLLLVGWWSRVAGRADGAGTALLVGMGLTVPVGALCWWLSRPSPGFTKPEASPG
ncbi:MAG TPA: hypothetical protein VM848_16890 [Acidimicrobiia bacterium]|nr:hypothetical protein [Acidimicrobiia bacterium]